MPAGRVATVEVCMRGEEVPAGTPWRPRPVRDIRNVALIGPGGAGKTVLVQALRGAVGLGRDEAARAPGALHLSALEHLGVKLNLLDTPGSPDFVGALRAGLRAVDGVLFVVSAVGGLDPVTAQLWQECADAGVARAVAVTQLDGARADFDETVALCQRVLDDAVLPISLPMHDDDGGVAGLVTLLDQRVVDSTSGTRVARAADPEHLRLIADLRAELVEAVLEHSEDDALLDDYLRGVEPELATLTRQAHRAVARADLTVVLATAAPAGVGLVELLDFFVNAFPSPLERLCPPATRPDGSPVSPLSADPDGLLAAEILGCTGDPPDRMSYVRVWSGVLRSGVDVPCPAGDICLVPAPTGARTGDTLSDPAEPLLLEPWVLPEPQLPIAVQAAAGPDGERLRAALDLIADDDPTVRLERRPDTGQQLIWCVGPDHAEVLLDRLRTGYGLAVLTPPVQIAAERCRAVVIAVPTAFLRSVLSDLSGRRGHVLHSSPEAEDPDRSLVFAEISEQELLTYAAALRAVSHGTGRFVVRPSC
jgi:elongation factor G